MRKATKPFVSAQQTLVSAEGALRQALQGLVSDYWVQVHHARRSFKDHYLRAFNEAAGVHLGEAALPEMAPPSLVAQAIAWLEDAPCRHAGPPRVSLLERGGSARGDEAEDEARDQQPDPQGVFDIFGDKEEAA